MYCDLFNLFVFKISSKKASLFCTSFELFIFLPVNLQRCAIFRTNIYNTMLNYFLSLHTPTVGGKRAFEDIFSYTANFFIKGKRACGYIALYRQCLYTTWLYFYTRDHFLILLQLSLFSHPGLNAVSCRLRWVFGLHFKCFKCTVQFIVPSFFPSNSYWQLLSWAGD